MERAKRIRIVAGLVLVLVLGIGGYIRSQSIKDPVYRGGTMGTTFRICISGKIKKSDLNGLTEQIDEELQEINRQMSTWDPESEISRFNHSKSMEPIAVSAEFGAVVSRALSFSQSTGGAFDPTLQPLLNLWGFGSEAITNQIPSDERIMETKEATGCDKVELISPTRLRKTQPNISLALGAIAKGYGVDVVARILKENELENWMVEIGGEVMVSGENPDGDPWRIGIQYPSPDPETASMQGILHVSSGAVATSGNYRNYLIQDGVLYSHILDPRSGQAVLSNTASVTVFAPSCTDADAIATALFVMGPVKGLAWIEEKPLVEALFLVRDKNDAIIEKFSSGFRQATGYTSHVK